MVQHWHKIKHQHQHRCYSLQQAATTAATTATGPSFAGGTDVAGSLTLFHSAVVAWSQQVSTKAAHAAVSSPPLHHHLSCAAAIHVNLHGRRPKPRCTSLLLRATQRHPHQCNRDRDLSITVVPINTIVIIVSQSSLLPTSSPLPPPTSSLSTPSSSLPP